MVQIQSYNQMLNHLKRNIGKYVIEHGGEYLVLDRNFQETFFSDKDQWEAVKNSYKRNFGNKPIFVQIPTKIPEDLKSSPLEELLEIFHGNKREYPLVREVESGSIFGNP